jgi:two-component system, cell cycle response regulator DivK
MMMLATQEPTTPVVLLVEDSQDERDMYTRQLVATGYSVQVAVNGEDALQRVAAQVPDVVVMDLAMPVMDGWEAIRRLKEAHPSVPVIVLSGHTGGEGGRRAKEAGGDVLLTKPFGPEALELAVRVILKRRAEADSSQT